MIDVLIKICYNTWRIGYSDPEVVEQGTSKARKYSARVAAFIMNFGENKINPFEKDKTFKIQKWDWLAIWYDRLLPRNKFSYERDFMSYISGKKLKIIELMKYLTQHLYI